MNKQTPYFLIFAVAVLLYIPFLPGLYFCHDDWTLLEMSFFSNGLFDSIKSFINSSFFVRPTNAILFPILYSLFGLNEIGYQLTYLFILIIQSCLFYRLLIRSGLSKNQAILATIFSLLIPSRGMTKYWLGTLHLNISIICAFLSIELYQVWKESNKWIFYALSIIVYLFGIATYEAMALFPLILLLEPFKRKDVSWYEEAINLLPYALLLAFGLYWQKFGGGQFYPSPPSRPISISIISILSNVFISFYLLTIGNLAMLVRSLPEALFDLSIIKILICILTSILLANLIKLEPVKNYNLKFLAAIFILSCLPYAITQDYKPSITGEMARTTLVASFPICIIITLFLSNIPKIYSRYAIFSILSLFMLSSYQFSANYADLKEIHNLIITKLSTKIKNIPYKSNVIIKNVPSYFNVDVNPIPIFSASWSIGSAIRIALARKDLNIEFDNGKLKNNVIVVDYNEIK